MKHKFGWIVAAISFISPDCFSQTPPLYPTAAKCFGGSSHEEFFGGSLTLDGGYLLTGLSYSKDGDINSLNAYDSADAFVVRTTSTGVKLWSKTYGGNDYDKIRFGFQDTDSNFVFTGTTRSVDGDVVSNLGNSDLFVLKTDPNGNVIWFKCYGGTGYESGRHILQVADGGYIVSGYATSSNFDVPANRGQHDGWIFKIDINGTLLWSQTYGGNDVDRIRCVIPTNDGGFAFAGATASNNLQCPQGNGGSDFWVGKVDSVGNLIWSQQFGGSEDDFAYHISMTSQGSFIITGNTASNDGDITGFHGDIDGWILLVDDSGNLIWEQCLGGTSEDRLYRTFEMPDGDFISGGFSKSNDYDLNSINHSQGASFWLLRLDSLNNLRWSYVTGGSAGDFANELLFNPVDSNYVMMGDTRSNNLAVSGNHGGDDFWFVKLGWQSFSGIDEDAAGWSTYFVSQTQMIHVFAPESGLAEIALFDMSGKKLGTSAKMPVSKGRNEFRLPLSGPVAAGIYEVLISTSEITLSLKINLN